MNIKVNKKPQEPQKQKPLKADYKDATPKQVGKAVLTYRPKSVNPNI